MKKDYNKPEIEMVKFESLEATMDDILNPSMGTGGSDEEDYG